MTTPYAWPYDGPLDPRRTALLVVGAPGTPGAPATATELADALRPRGGVVVSVTAAPPRRGPAGPAPIPEADHATTAAGVDGFFGSDLDAVLRRHGRDTLLLTGAWLETHVHSTMRSANDRGYECLLVLDACTAADPGLVAASRSQIEMSGGIFGAVGSSSDVVAHLTGRTPA